MKKFICLDLQAKLKIIKDIKHRLADLHMETEVAQLTQKIDSFFAYLVDRYH